MDTDSFVLNMITKENIEDIKNLNSLFVFSKPDKIVNYSVKKVLGKFNIETLKKIWIDYFLCLKSRTYSFERNDKNTNRPKSFLKSQVKDFEFEKNYKCLFGGDYREE